MDRLASASSTALERSCFPQCAAAVGVHVGFGACHLLQSEVADLVEGANPNRSCDLAFGSLPLAWPGMDAEVFLDASRRVPPPLPTTWLWAIIETILGAVLLWVVARSVPQGEPLLGGWLGMLGLILLLHFGSFQIVGLLWQGSGVDAKPIMSAPLRSTSLSEFWGKRWNLGFRQLAHELIFRPLHRTLGAATAGFLVFVASGLIHDLVISLPARAGYGLPTAYFVLQGAGMTVEHSEFGKRLGLGHGVRGWSFMALFLAGPAFWLFHPWFVLRVILPFMQAIHAL